MTKFGQAEYNDYMAKIYLIKFLKRQKKMISAAEIQKIFTENFRHQRTRYRRILCWDF